MTHTYSNALDSEIDRLDPMPNVVSLSSGTQVHVLPLKMRQLFRLMRIVTRGGSTYLPLLRDVLTSGTDDVAEVFGSQLMAIVIIALPEAENEAVEFVQSVVEPVGIIERNDKQSKERNFVMRSALDAELDNPDLGDLVTIFEAVIMREKDDLVALGKRLKAMFDVAAKANQFNQKPSQVSLEPTHLLSDPLPEPVTSSPQNTDGPTPSYLTSPSAG